MTNYQLPHNVLVIAYYFPPLGLGGVQRTLKFVKYLPQYGWNPTVLTVEARGYFAKDEGLLHEIEGLPVEIVRTHSIDPLHFFRKFDIVKMPSARVHSQMSKLSQYFFIPDNKIGWKKRALEIAREILSKKKFDVIFATAPPYTDFLIGKELKEEFHLPLVIDYRDAWIDNTLHFYLTPLHRHCHFKLEKSVLKLADRIITINRRIKELIIMRYPNLTHNEIDIIPQGFDQDDFDRSAAKPDDGKFRITYSGTFYYNRTPKYFLCALKIFLEKNPGTRDKIEAVFIGNFNDENVSLVHALHLGDVVKVHGYVPHNECISILQQSTVLWMMLGDSTGDEMMSTGKLFEYLGTRKPILGCVPDGVAKQTIQDYGAGFLTSPKDVQAIAEAIEMLYKLHQTNSLPKVKEDYVIRFERHTLTGQLAKVLSSLVEVDSSDLIITPES